MASIDLHCHSHRSDGALAPAALVQRAALRGVRVLALTDHDTLDGLDEAHAAGREQAVSLIPGVEISVTWSGRTIHVVGLDVDPAANALQAGLREVRSGRTRRGQAIGERLEKLGLGGALEGALRLASRQEMLSRTHFARHLVATGAVKDMASAFRRYLGEGKPAYVRHTWASLERAVQWIVSAGGVAVLAHPARYGLRSARLRSLLIEFRAAGGTGIEVVCASQRAGQIEPIATLAAECGLLASAGSDFHSPDESWLDLGELDAIPAHCDPIWRHPQLARIAALS